MKTTDLDYEKVGRALVGMAAAADLANHDWVKSSADHDVLPRQDQREMQFVVDVFTKKVPVIAEKYFK